MGRAYSMYVQDECNALKDATNY